MSHSRPNPLLRDLFIGRQAIYNDQLGVYAYELLFRSAAPHSSIDAEQADGATSQVILTAFQDIGIERLAGSRPVAINLSAGLLEQASSLPIPPQRVIFDLPRLLARPQTLPALQHLKKLGYTLALDDFEFDTRLKPIYELVDLIKIDVRTTEENRLARLPKLLSRLGALSAAKKVESLEEYEQLRDQGFQLFQGYFLSRPRTLHGRSINAGKHALMTLLVTLHNPHSETKDIVNALGSDPSLSYKLLRLINSAFFSPPRPISSLHDAIVILGRRRLAAWATLVALGHLDEHPPEIFRIALTRGRMCERLSEHIGHEGGDGFVVGLFSAFNLLLDQPLDSLLKPLPLAAPIRQAILAHDGQLGGLLEAVLAYERNRWRDLARSPLPMDLLRDARLEAIEWATSLSGLLRSN